MSIVNDIKNQVKKSGTNKQKFMYFKSGTKARIRFLDDMEDGIKVLFHDSYTEGINTPCQETFGRVCKYCNNEDLRHRDLYAWSVWDHEAKEVKLLMAPVNSFSPVPSLVAMYETYGTLLDRDYVIQKNGQGTNSSFSVIPMDKSKFINKKAKPFTKSKVLSLIDKGFSEENEEDETDIPLKSKKRKTTKPSASDYDEYTPRELYEECIARGIDATKKKPARYYIKFLEEDDMEMAAEEEAEDEEIDYDEMTTKELYKLCIDKGIKVRPKKARSEYLELLEELEEENEDEEDDWEDEEEDEEDDWE